MISAVSKYAIDSILKGIEGLDEYEAEYFYKKLAQQSHDHEIQAFIDEAKKREGKK